MNGTANGLLNHHPLGQIVYVVSTADGVDESETQVRRSRNLGMEHVAASSRRAASSVVDTPAAGGAVRAGNSR